MLTCHHVADYFLKRVSGEDAGDLMSNLKLQKLAYYAQGLHLALYDTPLFPEPIEAWIHGPVVPDLYHRFKHFGSGAIEEIPDFDITQYTEEELEVLEEAYNVYAQFSAFKLRNMTHAESPWRTTPENQVISQESMRQFFKTRLV